MFANLKAQATAAASAAAEQATKAAADIKSRVDTAQAGNKLLSEGGEGMKKKLLAKQASKNATTIDTGFMYGLGKVMSDYKETADKMKMAGDLASEDQDAFKKLGESYGKRAAEFEVEVNRLQATPTPANISEVETDAITILSTKMGAMGLNEKVRSSISGATGSNAPADGGADGETGEKKGFMDKLNEKGKQFSDRANERVANASAGKKMVDEGGDDMVTKLVAKKASRETTAADKALIDQLTKTIEAYGDAESKLKEALSEDKGEEAPSFSSMAEKYGARGTELQALLTRLAPIPEAIETHESERDGILYMTTQMSVKSATASAGVAVTEATKGSGGYPQ